MISFLYCAVYLWHFLGGEWWLFVSGTEDYTILIIGCQEEIKSIRMFPKWALLNWIMITELIGTLLCCHFSYFFCLLWFAWCIPFCCSLSICLSTSEIEQRNPKKTLLVCTYQFFLACQPLTDPLRSMKEGKRILMNATI